VRLWGKKKAASSSDSDDAEGFHPDDDEETSSSEDENENNSVQMIHDDLRTDGKPGSKQKLKPKGQKKVKAQLESNHKDGSQTDISGIHVTANIQNFVKPGFPPNPLVYISGTNKPAFLNFLPPPTVIPTQKSLLATVGPASVVLNTGPVTASTTISSKPGLQSVITNPSWFGGGFKQHHSSVQGLTFSGFPSEKDPKITSPTGGGGKGGDFSRLHVPSALFPSHVLQPNKQIVQAQVLMTAPEPPEPPQHLEAESEAPTAATKPALSEGSFADFMADALFSKKTT